MIEKHNQEFKKVRKALYYVICYNIIYNIEGVKTYQMAFNKYSDLSQEEFSAMMRGHVPDSLWWYDGIKGYEIWNNLFNI